MSTNRLVLLLFSAVLVISIILAAFYFYKTVSFSTILSKSSISIESEIDSIDKVFLDSTALKTDLTELGIKTLEYANPDDGTIQSAGNVKIILTNKDQGVNYIIKEDGENYMGFKTSMNEDATELYIYLSSRLIETSEKESIEKTIYWLTLWAFETLDVDFKGNNPNGPKADEYINQNANVKAPLRIELNE